MGESGCCGKDGDEGSGQGSSNTDGQGGNTPTQGVTTCGATDGGSATDSCGGAAFRSLDAMFDSSASFESLHHSNSTGEDDANGDRCHCSTKTAGGSQVSGCLSLSCKGSSRHTHPCTLTVHRKASHSADVKEGIVVRKTS